jgi:hypothetical protein
MRAACTWYKPSLMPFPPFSTRVKSICSECHCHHLVDVALVIKVRVHLLETQYLTHFCIAASVTPIHRTMSHHN